VPAWRWPWSARPTRARTTSTSTACAAAWTSSPTTRAWATTRCPSRPAPERRSARWRRPVAASGPTRALYLAERRVDLAKTAAQLQDAQIKLNQLDREHDQILLANSRREADMARLELARQRLQNQLAQEEAARLQQQGLEYSQQVEQARAEAERAKKLAAAQSKVARAARREAALAAQAAKAMRAQMDDGDAATPSSSGKDKPAGQHPGGH